MGFVDNPLAYYSNYFVLKASFANIYNGLTEKSIKNEIPQMTKETFWDYQLGKGVTGFFYECYIYPRLLIFKLQEIAAYCTKENIRLILFIPPSHIDLQNKISEYQLVDYYVAYKRPFINGNSYRF